MNLKISRRNDLVEELFIIVALNFIAWLGFSIFGYSITIRFILGIVVNLVSLALFVFKFGYNLNVVLISSIFIGMYTIFLIRKR